VDRFDFLSIKPVLGEELGFQATKNVGQVYDCAAAKAKPFKQNTIPEVFEGRE